MQGGSRGWGEEKEPSFVERSLLCLSVAPVRHAERERDDKWATNSHHLFIRLSRLLLLVYRVLLLLLLLLAAAAVREEEKRAARYEKSSFFCLVPSERL